MTVHEYVERNVRVALGYLGPEPESWVIPRAGIDHNVLIVGGGQNGVGLAFAFRRVGIGGVSVVDAAAEGEAGLWEKRARMVTLRTQKTVIGPENGFTALSFAAWYEGLHGANSFARIGRIARKDWAAYLRWFQRTVEVPVRHSTTVVDIEPFGQYFRVHLSTPDGVSVETTRKVVLANGIAGVGAPSVPEVLSGLPDAVHAHTADDIDFARLKGKVVAVIGAAASAFDAAAAALEAGAESVHLFCRRPEIVSVAVAKPRVYPGAQENFPTFPDDLRWRLFNRLIRNGNPPPADSITRVTAYPNFRIHLSAPWHEARIVDGRVVAKTGTGTHRFDFVVAGTGYVQDPHRRPELARIADAIALWRDRYDPPEEERNPGLETYPYLGLGLEFTEKAPGTAPYLRNLHCYTPATQLSYGRPIGDVPAMRSANNRLTLAIVRDLFFDDFDGHVARMNKSGSGEYSRELYAASVWHPETEPAGDDRSARA